MPEDVSKQLESDEPKKVEKPVKVAVKGGAVSCFDNGVKINTDQRLSVLDSGPVPAYAASDAKGERQYFALVCPKHLIPRHKAKEAYASIINPRLAKLVYRGVVYWEPAKEQRYVFVYDRIHGKPLIAKDAPLSMGLRQDDIMGRVVKPLVDVLQDFRDKDFVHGAIRPDNLFENVSNGKSDPVTLGDCLATPASYTQPALFQTIARGKADAIGRGLGTRMDDMYAFGVTLAVLMRTSDPFSSMDDEDITRGKMEQGSFAFLTSKERFQGTILELLRGLLHDDEAQRWTIDDVLVWMEGRRLQPKQGGREHKAIRPLVYCGQKYLYPSFLAMDLDINPVETRRLVESEELEQWIDRSLEDKETLERLQISLKSARERGTGAGYEDRLVANVSAALDPDSPLRFRGLRLMAEAVGASLAEVLVLKQDVQPFADMFTQNIMLTWIGAQISSNLDFGALISSFDECRLFVTQQKIGYGIERCLYLLSPEAFCLSEKLDGYYVLSAEDMIFSFEDLCAKGKAPAHFLDRHSVAFLAIRDSKLLEKTIYDIDSNQPRKRILAELKIMAMIQKREKLKNFPALGMAFHKRLECVYEALKDKKTRDKVTASMAELAKKGNLSKMVDLIVDGALFKTDGHGFSQARTEYIELQREYEGLEVGLQNKKTFGRKEARGYAAIASAALAVLAILIFLFLFFVKGVSF